MIQEERMNSEINQTILGVVDEMVRLAREPAAPAEGEARLKRRVQEHTGLKGPREAEPRTPVKIDVLWDQEAVTGSVHYDALLRVPGWGSVSIGYCSERGLPWALRGGRPVKGWRAIEEATVSSEGVLPWWYLLPRSPPLPWCPRIDVRRSHR
jgi:hypothetical protein